jgi:hypothetical protein
MRGNQKNKKDKNSIPSRNEDHMQIQNQNSHTNFQQI